jgi:PAS domain S-box-containing protein
MLDERVDILVVDDDEDDFVIVKDLLDEISANRFLVQWEPDYDRAYQFILNQDFDVYLIDYRLGKRNGLELLKEAVNINRSKPVIMLTGQGETRVDMEAMQIGAADFLVKDKIDPQSIERSIRYALSNAQTMHKLYEQEKKYRSLFEQSLSAIFITDENLQIVDVNEAMCLLFDYRVDDIQGKEPDFLFADQEDYHAMIDALEREGHLRNYEILLINNNKRKILSNISITRFLDSDHKVRGFQAIIEDISERKKIQQELIQLEKLIMTGNIARSIAHEVRNPLTNINLALEQFSEIAAQDDTLEVYLDIIKRNTKRINQLISEMLKSSKPSELQLQPCKLNDILENALSLAKDRLKLREIKLVKLYDKDLPEIPLDFEKLSMALLNIINNALEAVEPRQGVLSLQTRIEGAYQVMQICDNGPGIGQEEINRLFDAFHTGKKGGMGLGLTFTQNIVNSHGAKISVESTLEKGTCFWLSFKNEPSSTSSAG